MTDGFHIQDYLKAGEHLAIEDLTNDPSFAYLICDIYKEADNPTWLTKSYVDTVDTYRRSQ